MPPSDSAPSGAGAVASPSLSITVTPEPVGLSSVTAGSAGASGTSSCKSGGGSGRTPSSFAPASASGPVYSPTTTADWLHCPMYRRLRGRWKPRTERPSVDQLLGRAIHAGLAAYYASGQDPSAALPAVDLVLSEFADDGEHTAEGLRLLAARGIRAALTPPLLSDTEQVVAAEAVVGECRIDLITRDSRRGGLIVTDFKVKRQLKSDWLPRTLREYDTSWQLRHEAWAASAQYGEPVVQARVQLIVLAPRTVAHVTSVPMSEARLAQWLQSAERVWADMAREDAGEAAPFMRPDACTRYGLCEFYDLCHVLDGDETRADVLYERVWG